MLVARAITLRMLSAPHAGVELNPVIRTLTAAGGDLPTAIATLLLVLAALLIAQVAFVAVGAGRQLTRLSAWIFLAIVVADAAWDLLQVLR
jgi:hypothetical protein